jgi:hypothetical protein
MVPIGIGAAGQKRKKKQQDGSAHEKPFRRQG